ncbi:hypothetical protein HDU86_004678 [Geranomyces michiganensis]|nr:hypothetical protein HDU86_004678 [Geranomyces michiganensis]
MIVLQIGQCGIQIGQQLFNILEQEDKSKDTVQFPLSTFRQTIIDTERKTWRKHQRAGQKQKFPTTYIDNGTSGRGNNWAHGYWEISQLDSILDTLRRETEASSNGYDGCLMVHSVAGGTGSGLGSRVAEEMRDAYPKNYLSTCAVLPFVAGDTALQHYNSLLSLGWAQRYSDMVAIFSNDAVMNTVSRQAGLVAQGPKAAPIKLDTLNEYIAHCIAGLVLPTTPVRKIGDKLEYDAKPLPCDLWNAISELTPVPGCKMVNFSSSATTSFSASRPQAGSLRPTLPANWDDIRTAMSRNMASLPSGIRRRCITGRMQARGVVGGDYWKKASVFETQLATRLGIVNVREHFHTHISSLYAVDFKSTTRALDLCYNGSDSARMLDDVTAKAQAMFDERAYLHWYERYGGAEVLDSFDECFESLRVAADAYKDVLGEYNAV